MSATQSFLPLPASVDWKNRAAIRAYADSINPSEAETRAAFALSVGRVEAMRDIATRKRTHMALHAAARKPGHYERRRFLAERGIIEGGAA
jgi:hypothetical protein